MAAVGRHGSFHGEPAEWPNGVLVEYGIFLFLGFWDGAF